MATWSKNNLAHRRTYIVLRILEQTSLKFKAAGPQKIKNLSFWVVGESAAIRKAKARSLASQMNNMFVMAFLSEFESGITEVQSINKMTTVLTNGAKTINHLADVADQCYDFFGEDES